jgi:hypothetical protein
LFSEPIPVLDDSDLIAAISEHHANLRSVEDGPIPVGISVAALRGDAGR